MEGHLHILGQSHFALLQLDPFLPLPNVLERLLLLFLELELLALVEHFLDDLEHLQVRLLHRAAQQLQQVLLREPVESHREPHQR